MLNCQFPNCKKPYEYGAHGVRDGKLYSEFWCSKHLRDKKPKQDVLEFIRSIAKKKKT